ncbi:alpha/beta fold hydrolase [Escherichia coli]
MSRAVYAGSRSYHDGKGLFPRLSALLAEPVKSQCRAQAGSLPGTLPINLAQLITVRRIREFDDLITARIHGYADAIDYYRQCSAMPMLNRIAKPTLIIHAKDDPLWIIGDPETGKSPPQVEYQLTEHGGHVGFLAVHYFIRKCR